MGVGQVEVPDGGPELQLLARGEFPGEELEYPEYDYPSPPKRPAAPAAPADSEGPLAPGTGPHSFPGIHTFCAPRNLGRERQRPQTSDASAVPLFNGL